MAPYGPPAVQEDGGMGSRILAMTARWYHAL